MAIRFDIDPAGCDGVLARLAALGFSEEAVRNRLGLDDINDLQLRAVPIYRAERLQPRDPLVSAIDLFMLQGTLPTSELDDLLGPREQQALVACGLLERSDGTARLRASLYPVGPDLIFSDHASHELDPHALGDDPHDRVMYVGTDSRWLARVTLRNPVDTALDLCCGSGIHALLAAAHARQVTAVDINPRAVQCTTFNVRARGLKNVEALPGDLYAPLGDRRFDLITANPPFVPAPEQKVGFRDGGPSGEEVQRRIIEGLPRHLGPTGVAQIVTEFGESDADPLERRLRRWLGDAAIDIHVLRLRTHSAQAYAIGHADGDGPAAFLRSVDDWATNLRAHGYTRIVSVLLAFRRTAAPPWSRSDEARPPTRAAGNELEAVFAAERLARDPALRARLRGGRVVRTGPVGIFESRALGTDVPRSIQARLFGQALS
ncbi:MAG TPA: methyltransferase, partial [Burkholderiaceae bacterium]|nr:methyltransferase [Burkholderiaceae bacterium]